MTMFRSATLAAILCAATALPAALRAADPKPAKPPETAPKKPDPEKDKPEKLDPKLAAIPAVNDPELARKFSHMRTPQETIASIELPPGYHLELVASEPDIISPVCMAWDGNGAMYVAEMRTYMLDINGGKTMENKSRVSRLESTKNDGHYDRITPFADGLLLPRQLLPLDDRILVRLTNSKDIFAFRDLDGDGIAEEKTEFYKGGSVGGNLEHQSSNLQWNLDNWMYQTVDDTRFRYTTGKVETQKLPIRVGQWGYAMDDTGRLIFATAGGEMPAHDFQAPLIYGKLSLPGELAKDFTEVFGLVPFTDYQGGTGRFKPTVGGLNRFTGCAGPCVYRGDALPKDLYGDYILPEPVGRLIRRAKITNEGGKTILTNAYDKKEFLASTDANFRPVYSATGPDGALYILDMYHGIIQESNWTGKGSYLRKEIERFGLDKNINGGRIYRLTYEGIKPNYARPQMLKESPAELVKHLAHPNGWWRDTAQKLLVLKGDKSIVSTLQEMARTHENPLARLHALWTIEGLGAIEPAFLIEKLKDADGNVRAAAVRIAEPFLKANDAKVLAAVKATASDPDPNVVKQYVLSVQYAALPSADALTKAAIDANPKNPVIATVVKNYKDQIAAARAEKEKPGHLDKKYASSFIKGKDMFQQMCIACHGPNGQGAPAPEGEGLTLAPPLKGSKRLLAIKDVPVQIFLHGLIGPHENGKLYPNEMAGFPWADDQLVANILTYVRNDWGNKAPPIEPKEVAEIRKSSKRTLPFTFPQIVELMESLTPTAGPTRTLPGDEKPTAKPNPTATQQPK